MGIGRAAGTDKPRFRRAGRAAELPIGDNIIDAAKAAHEALRLGRPYSRWLLIFDNADDPADIKAHFPAGPGHILVTSRNPRWSTAAEPVEIECSRQESLDHLQRRVRSLTDEEADQVAEALGDLAARGRAGRRLARREWNIRKRLSAGIWPTSQASSSQPARRLSDAAGGDLAARIRPFAGGVSRGRPAASVVRILRARADPDGPAPERSDDQVARRFNPQLREPRMIRALNRAIARYSLAKVDRGTNAVQVHRLIQAFVRASMETGRRGDQSHPRGAPSAHRRQAHGRRGRRPRKLDEV